MTDAGRAETRSLASSLADRPDLRAAGAIARAARKAVLAKLRGIREGALVVVEGGESHAFGDPASPLRAAIRVHDPAFWAAAGLRGSVGAGESYTDGWWTADDLVAVMRIFLRNRDVLDGMERGLAALAAPFLRLFHARRDNTKSGSRRNIAAHYDLGNDFFGTFLDETWMYSCAYFEREGASLAEASAAKNDRICRKLALGPSDHVVEIGTGWGGFALHAASRYGCRVTTTTISGRQHAFAKERIERAGLADRVTLLLDDYRDLRGAYDALVSIEMVEAVGARHLPTWTRTCGRLLGPGGRACIQSIVIREELYGSALRNVDFIQRHVFPGSFIPSVSALASAFARTSDLLLVSLEDIGPHYATTLRMWRERFLAARDRVDALGYPEPFRRLWEFYLAYCEGGFAERALGDVQMVLHKPRCASPIPRAV
ncbi:MAG: Tuberculostearic acid methyltransferase UfaA1 [Planctomycetes bacterium]|nr:Tuberculostearic acid methyltransferase UfaA1 [Planctomycetota bacterium]